MGFVRPPSVQSSKFKSFNSKKLLLILAFLLNQNLFFIQNVGATPVSAPDDLLSMNSLRVNNFVTRQIPRFKIPRGGNLVYYNQPLWEILYYDKFGVFPNRASQSFQPTESSSMKVNTSQYLRYLNKLRRIHSLLDKDDKYKQGENENSKIEKDFDPPNEKNDFGYMSRRTPLNENSLPSESEQDNDNLSPNKILIQEQEQLLNPIELKNDYYKKQNEIDKTISITKKTFDDKENETLKDNDNLFMADTDPTWYRSKVPKSVLKLGFLIQRMRTNLFHGDDSNDGDNNDEGRRLNLRGKSSLYNGRGLPDRKFQTQGW